MTESPFIHLAVRSSYSLLESMITPKGLKAWCVEQGMPAVAITDRNNLFGALEISLTLTAYRKASQRGSRSMRRMMSVTNG